MEKIVEQGRLYDFYGELLTPHQCRIYEAAVYEDLSLSEIAEQEGISRQGVHDLLKRVTGILREYEDKLHMIARFDRISSHLRQMEAFVQGSGRDKTLGDPVADREIDDMKDGILRILREMETDLL